MKGKMQSDAFLQIKERVRMEEKVEDSRFIATAQPVNSEEEAVAFIAEMKKEYHDATHNCWAWKTGHGRVARYRFNDDGEPSGTAGRPILKAIEGRNISNVSLVVTRYFGGTKLGTGGLMRSYGKLAQDLLKATEAEKKYVSQELKFSVSFDFVSVAHNIINTFSAELKDSQYGEDVTFIVDIRSSKYKLFRDKLTEATNGQIRFR